MKKRFTALLLVALMLSAAVCACASKEEGAAEENLPEAHRDLQDRDPPEAVRDLPAVDREPELRTDRRECLPNSVQPRREKRLSSLA